jgi:hypothetical protein
MIDARKFLDPFKEYAGSGASPASDEWLDKESPFDNGWGSAAATTFNVDEAPERKKQKFERLYKWQNGKGGHNRKTEILDSHRENDLETFMSVLEMPEGEREVVRELFQNLDISSNNFGGGRPYEKIILALCSLVSDKHLSDRKNPSFDDRLLFTDEYRDLMDVTGMNNREHQQIRASIRGELSYF